jgi:glycerol transport system ATP-binding protein
LDYKLREELRSELRGYFGGEERAVVYATAEPREALELGGACAVLHEGKLLQHGPVTEVYAAPSSEQVARIITDPELNVFDVTVLEDRVFATNEPGFGFAREGALARLPLGAARIGVRAHDLSLEPRGPSAIKLRAAVTLEELSGSESLVRAQSSGGLEWTAQWQGTRRAELGAQLDLYIDPNSLLLFNASGLAWRA